MCYSAEVSFGTFAFVVIIATFLWFRNSKTDRTIGLILIIVVLMQLIEGVLWLHPECDTINQHFSAMIPIILYLQPLLINAIVAFYVSGRSSGYATIALLLLCFLPFQLIQIYQRFGKCVTKNNGQLDWTPLIGQVDSIGILPGFIYDAAMLFPFLTLKNSVFGISYTALSIISRIGFEGNYTQTWPSLWCHFVNGLAVLALCT
jgi:hypothetical protein